MGKTAYVFLADGFEEVEAFTPVDMLRRAGINVKTVSFEKETVTGGHNITVMADICDKNFVLPDDAALLFLPGGGQGTDKLLNSPVVEKALEKAKKMNIIIAAICAAPKVLHKYNLLDGKKATAFPSVQPELHKANITGAAVEQDGNIITGRAAGVSLEFSKTLIEALSDTTTAERVIASVYP